MLTGDDVDLCAPLFDPAASVWKDSYRCYYSATAKTLVLSLDDGQPVLPSIPLTTAQKQEHCVSGSAQQEVALGNSDYSLDLAIENLYSGPCACPVLSVLSSPGVLFQGTVQWQVQAVQVVEEELARANEILSRESGQIMFNEEHCQIMSNVGDVAYSAVVSVRLADGSAVQESATLGYRFEGATWDASCADLSPGLAQFGLLADAVKLQSKLYVAGGKVAVNGDEMSC